MRYIIYHNERGKRPRERQEQLQEFFTELQARGWWVGGLWVSGGNGKPSSASVWGAPFGGRSGAESCDKPIEVTGRKLQKISRFQFARLSTCLSLTRGTSGSFSDGAWSSGSVKKKKKGGPHRSAPQHQGPQSPNDCNVSLVIILSKSDQDSNPFHPLHQLLSISSLVSLFGVTWHFVKCSNLLSCQGEDKLRCTEWYSTNVTAAAASLNSAGKAQKRHDGGSLPTGPTVCACVCFQIHKAVERKSICLLWGSAVRGDFLESRFLKWATYSSQNHLLVGRILLPLDRTRLHVQPCFQSN